MHHLQLGPSATRIVVYLAVLGTLRGTTLVPVQFDIRDAA
jgi:hypothetical protein